MRIDASRLRHSISQVIRSAIQSLHTGEIITDSLYHATRNHVQIRQPGSTHWALDKITKGNSSENSGSVDVDIPGATRMYHDITIVPRRAKALTIPIHAAAYGKRAADIDGLFKPKTDMNILAVAMSGQLVPMFALCKRAFQRQDPTLLPTDGTFAENISNRWWRSFCIQLDNLQTNENGV